MKMKMMDREAMTFFLYLACSIGLMIKVMFEFDQKERSWLGLVTIGIALGFCLIGYLVGQSRGFERGRNSVTPKEK